MKAGAEAQLSRMGQAAREKLGFGGEHKTALPNDIVQLDQKAQERKKTYQAMTDRANDFVGQKKGLTAVFSTGPVATEKPINALGRLFDTAAKDAKDTDLSESYKKCAATCLELGTHENDLYKDVRDKFIDPKERFIKQDLKEVAKQMETVNNLRLDLDNQKRKLANSQENAERKAHYQEKVTKAEEALEMEIDFLRRTLESLLEENEDVRAQRASLMSLMQAMKDYHAKALETLTALDLQLDFSAHTSYTPAPKPVIARDNSKTKELPELVASASDLGETSAHDGDEPAPSVEAMPAPPPRRTSLMNVRAEVLYDFDGHEAGDLRVREGDIILVLSQDGEWWEGILNGERGYFPGNYVHLL